MRLYAVHIVRLQETVKKVLQEKSSKCMLYLRKNCLQVSFCICILRKLVFCFLSCIIDNFRITLLKHASFSTKYTPIIFPGQPNEREQPTFSAPKFANGGSRMCNLFKCMNCPTKESCIQMCIISDFSNCSRHTLSYTRSSNTLCVHFAQQTRKRIKGDQRRIFSRRVKLTKVDGSCAEDVNCAHPCTVSSLMRSF